MSKIVQAVNAMISNPGQISSVLRSSGELFFMYKRKYKWSMTKSDDDDYFLFYYPGDISIEDLAAYDGPDWEGTAMVKYAASEIGTKEAQASFAELFTLLKERVYGVNQVLDDIISDLDGNDSDAY